MGEKAILLILSSLFLLSLFLRRDGLSRISRVVLAALIIAGLAASAIFLLCGPEAVEYPTLNMIGDNLLTVVAVSATLVSWLFFRGVDLIVADPGLVAILAGIMVVGMSGFSIASLFSESYFWKKTSRLLLVTFLALSLIPIFYLMYWWITPESPQTKGVICQIPALMEFAIGKGVTLLGFTVANAVSARRLIVAVTAGLIVVIALGKYRSSGTLLILSATGLALLAQSFIISSNIPEAIYLYLAAALLLAGGKLFHRPPGTDRKVTSARNIALVTLILAASIIFGLYRLESFPVRYHPDEAMGGYRLLDAAQNWNVSASIQEAASRNRDDPNAAFVWQYWDPDARANHRTPISTHLTYLCLKIFPVNFITLRSSVVLVGVLTVLFLYLVLRMMFGVGPALLGAFLLATSSWQIALNRLHLPYTVTQLYALSCFFLFWKAQGKFWPVFYPLLGMALAFSNTFYPTFKMVYLVLPAFIFYRSLVERGYLRKQLPGLLLAVAAFLLILNARGIDPVGQLFLYRGVGADTVVHHRDYLNPSEAFSEAGSESLLAARSFILSIFDPDPFEIRRRNYIERGIYFNIFVLPFSVMGLFWCLFNFRRSGHSFLGLWLLLALLPNLVTGGGGVDRRATLVTAPMMAAAGVFLNVVWTEVVCRLPAGRTFRRLAAILAATGLVFVMLTSSAAEYFYPYQRKDSPQLREFRKFKAVDRFLEEVLDNDYFIYFLNRDSARYVPHHEVNWYLLLRLFSSSDRSFVKRPYQADSQRRVDRELLRSPDGEEGFVVFGPAAEKEFISSLNKAHPRSKIFSFRWDGRPPFEIVALVVESRGSDPDGESPE